MNHEDHKDREVTISKIFILGGLRGLSGSAFFAKFKSIAEHFQDVPGEGLFDFGVAWNRLAHSGLGILVPVVPFTGTDPDATVFLDPSDQVAALHESCNSATLRTSGIMPLESSS